jgi:hypothetical protein
MRYWLLVTLITSACIRIGTPPARDSCADDSEGLQLDAGRDTLAEAGRDALDDGVRPDACSALAELGCSTSDEGCEALFRCAAIDLDFRNAELPAGVSFSRDSPAYYVTAAGSLMLAANDVPRLDHGPSTGERLGLLVEGSRTNLVRWSSALDRWSTQDVAVRDIDLSGPDGNIAFALAPIGGTVSHRISLEPIPSFSYSWLSFSLFVKPLRSDHGLEVVLDALDQTTTLSYDLESGASRIVGSSGNLSRLLRTENYPGGWQRIALTVSRPDHAPVTGAALHRSQVLPLTSSQPSSYRVGKPSHSPIQNFPTGVTVGFDMPTKSRNGHQSVAAGGLLWQCIGSECTNHLDLGRSKHFSRWCLWSATRPTS